MENCGGWERKGFNTVPKQKNTNLEQHRNALDNLYAQFDFSKNPWGYGQAYIEYTRNAVQAPIGRNLAPGNVVDAGSGYGFFRAYTAGRLHIAVDLSAEIMKYDVGSPKVQSAVENLPFRSESIDNVVCVGVLRHCFDPSLFIAEAFRVLKPGGRLLISTPGADWPKNLWLTPWGPLVALSVVERWGRQFAKIFKRRRDNDASSADLAGVV